MNILVIGNGFDLAHELKTKYTDFLTFLKDTNNIRHRLDLEGIRLENFKTNHAFRLQELKNNSHKLEQAQIQDWIIKLYKTDDNNKVSSLIELVTNSYYKENIWTKYFLKKKDNIEKNTLDTWIDFESDIKDLIEELHYFYNKNYIPSINKDKENIFTDVNSFCEKFNETYTENQIPFVEEFDEEIDGVSYTPFIKSTHIEIIINDLNKFIEILEIYLAEASDRFNLKLSEVAKLTVNKVLSFNYTNTYKKIYDRYTNKISYDYVHGKIRTDSERTTSKNNMVLGIDEYLNDDLKDKYLEFIQFKKYFQRIYKKTGCQYKKWIEDMEQETLESNIYFYGHSLGLSDKDILKELIENKNTKITIFYHDDTAYAQLITNLVRIIGQDKLISWVHGSNPKIIFKQSSPELTAAG